MMKELGKNELKELQKQMPKLPKFKYFYTCLECDNQWESNEKYTIQSYCPRCHCGDLLQERNVR